MKKHKPRILKHDTVFVENIQKAVSLFSEEYVKKAKLLSIRQKISKYTKTSGKFFCDLDGNYLDETKK